MTVHTITFSPTGGTQKVADVFARTLSEGESAPIDLTERTLAFGEFAFNEDDVCIVAVPSFGGRVPAVAVSRLKQMTGGGARAVAIVVYGNRDYEDTLLELDDTLTEVGFRCVAAVTAVAEHSIMRQFATGRPHAQDEEVLKGYARSVRQRLEAGTASGRPPLPGNRPYKHYKGVPMKPKANKTCVACGDCAARCPVGAIPHDDPRGLDEEACISCMRCITVCKVQARSVGKLILAVGAQTIKKACAVPKQNELFLSPPQQ